ncbi:hypothetical protein D3C71_2068050 [compost metagenome]
MQVAGVVFLDTKLQGMRLPATATFTTGLGRGVEIALALILLQGLGHGGVLNRGGSSGGRGR